MAKIILSYRRSDSEAVVGRIRDRLSEYYGEAAVFIDIDSVPFGADFRKQISDSLQSDDILLAIIGPKWVGQRRAGLSRINEPTDPVRVEIETALQKRAQVIPVLIAGAKMPRESALPESLKQLPYLNAAEIDTGRDFHQHVERLIRAIDLIFGGNSDSASPALRKSETAVRPQAQSGAKPMDGKELADFAAFYCDQTIVVGRTAMAIGMVSWLSLGIIDLIGDTPGMLGHYRTLIAVPSTVAIFAASFSTPAQRYWQTFLSAICVVDGLVVFGAALVEYVSGTGFNIWQWMAIALVTVAIATLFPLRFANAVGICIFGLLLVCVFYVITKQPLNVSLFLVIVFMISCFVCVSVAFFRERTLLLLFRSSQRQSQRRRADFNAAEIVGGSAAG